MLPLRWILCLSALGFALPSQAQDGKLLYEQNCAACHLPDQMVVGPSLIEITKLYQKKPKEFLQWANKPQKKRPGVIDMPSMAHLGDANLLAIRDYMIKASAGLKEKPAVTKDPFERVARRPEVQRIFMPDVGPAAIAVALPGDLSYCFDAGDCRLRTIWRGDFINGWLYWKSNGKATGVIMGKVLWHLPEDTTLPATKFHGYELNDAGIPTFSYERQGAQFEETIEPAGKNLVRRFKVTTAQPLVLTIDNDTQASAGTRQGNKLTLTPEQAKSFTLTVTLS